MTTKSKTRLCPDCQKVHIDYRSERCRSCNARRVAAAKIQREKFNPQGHEKPMPSFERVRISPPVERVIRAAYAKADEYERARIRTLNRDIVF